MSQVSALQGISLRPSLDFNRPKTETAGFQNLFQQAIERVEGARAGAEEATNAFLTGESRELHSVALSVQRAELELELALQVRNKVVQAYQEIMRMQI